MKGRRKKARGLWEVCLFIGAVAGACTLVLAFGFALILSSVLGMDATTSLFAQGVKGVRPSAFSHEVALARASVNRFSTVSYDRMKLEDIERFVAMFSRGLSRKQRIQIAKAIDEECRSYGLSPRFVLAVIAIESGFRPRSVSPKGAIGLMQIRPFVGRALAKEVSIPWRGHKVLFHPGVNIRLGIRYLVRLIMRYKDLELALSAYNLGPRRLNGMLRRKKATSLRYAQKVLKVYEDM